jgi:fructosamine-3-kinase
MLPDALQDALASHLDGPLQEHATVGGGCIANACRIATDTRSYFLKWGDAEVARTFPPEAAGLKALRDADSPLVVPEVYAAEGATDHRPGFLLTAWIDTGSPSRGFWEDFGKGLAQLHRHTADRYGFERDNFIGRLPQSNTWMSNWPRFMRRERLQPQVERARNQGRWQTAWDRPLDRLFDRLPDLLPGRPPASVLHGDLWNGNYMVAASGTAALIDPATYYGHREADLAMTELFGGYDDRFYDAYRSAWPLEPGYEERRTVYNLYHLINHLNHFGGGYARRVKAALQRVA